MEAPIEELRAELALRNRQIAAIHRISTTLSTETAVDHLLKETLAEAMQAVQAGAGSILLYDAQRERLVFRHVAGPVQDSLLGREIEPTRGICGRVFTTGQPSIDADVSQSPDHAAEVDAETGYTTLNMVTIPLLSAFGDPLGVLQVLNKHQGQSMFDEQDVEVLMALFSYAAALKEAKLAEVVRRMGDLSHDIKNKITPVILCATTLQKLLENFCKELEETLATPSLEREGLMAAVREKTDQLRNFYPRPINTLLNSSHNVEDLVREIADCVKGAMAEPVFEPLSINEIVNAVVEQPQLRFDAERQKLTLDTQGLGTVPPVSLDWKLMSSALYNLINNAIPETPPGGTIWLRTSAQTDGGPFPEGHYLLIEVADNGRGMPEHVRKRLFTKDAISTKPGGTGLGTRIVKNAVEAHQGHISVVSQEGVGTTFQIKIPLERTETNGRK